MGLPAICNEIYVTDRARTSLLQSCSHPRPALARERSAGPPRPFSAVAFWPSAQLSGVAQLRLEGVILRNDPTGRQGAAGLGDLFGHPAQLDLPLLQLVARHAVVSGLIGK